MSIRIHLAGHLGNYTDRRLDVEVPGATDVLDLLARLSQTYPLLRDRILDEQDRTRPYVNIFLNDENIRDLQSEETKVRDGDELYILPSVAGG
ncbi:MAG: ubiquitin-like small modifier protein 1 [Nitrososphaerales archaeon]